MLTVKARVCETNDAKFGHVFRYEVTLFNNGKSTDIREYVNNRNEVKEFARKWKVKTIEYD